MDIGLLTSLITVLKYFSIVSDEGNGRESLLGTASH